MSARQPSRPVTPQGATLREANQFFRRQDFPRATGEFARVLYQWPGMTRTLAGSLAMARDAYLRSRRPDAPLRVGVAGWDLAHNAASRAHTLAALYRRFAEAEIIGPVFAGNGREVWEPVRHTDFVFHHFVVEDDDAFVGQAVDLVAAHPYDLIHLSKPRFPNIVIGLLYKLIWQSRVLVDIDDEELAFVGASDPLPLEDYLRQHGELPPLRDLAGPLWTRLGVGLADAFDGVTISNHVLQARYGGTVIPHTRDERVFKPSPELRRQGRAKLGLPPDRKVVLFLGTPAEYKGLHLVARAIGQLGRDDVTFLLAGGPFDEKLQAELQKLSGGRCRFTGYEPFDQIPATVAAADCCCFLQDPTAPAAHFQMPAKLSDALALGVPVISTRTEPTKALEKHSCCKFVGMNVEALVSALANIFSEAATLNRDGLAYFEQHLSQLTCAGHLKKAVYPLDAGLVGQSTRLFTLCKRIGLETIMSDETIPPHITAGTRKALVENSSVPSRVAETAEQLSNWDTRCYPTLTLSSDVGSLPSRLFIVPAYISPRNTTRYRAHHLAEACRHLCPVDIVDYSKVDQQWFACLEDPSVVVVLQRLPFDRKTEKFINAVRLAPCRIVYDVDDIVFHAPALEQWRIKGLPVSPEAYAKAMRYADAFLVSTKALRRCVEQLFARPTHVVQNLLSNEQLQLSTSASTRNSPAGNSPFTIGYASGSRTHERDLAVALPGLARFLATRSDARLACIGEVELPLEFRNRFATQILEQHAVDWRQLPDILASFDVQLIPLESCQFNESKSHIRFLESSAVGVPVVASNVGEQALSIQHQHTGYLAGDCETDWYNGLEWYYEDKQRTAAVGNTARRFAQDYFCISSPFRAYKLHHILVDCREGLMRDKLSFVFTLYNPLSDVKRLIDSVTTTVNVPHEILLFINSSDQDLHAYLRSLDRPNLWIVDRGLNVGKAKGANYLFNLASERFVCGADDDYEFPSNWVEQMLHTAKSIPALGWLSTNLSKDSSGLRDLGKVISFAGGASIYRASGVGGWVMFTTASAREALGHYTEHGLYGGIDGDYNRRARALGLVTGYVRCIVGKHKANRDSLPAWELFKQRIQDQMRTHGKQSDLVRDKFVDFFRDRTSALTCKIAISTSTTHNEDVWGDTHYAKGLAAALDRQGFSSRIVKHEHWYAAEERTPDVCLHLFGLHKYQPNPYSLNLLWIISHPELLDREFLLGFDFIFAASDELTATVRTLVPEIRTTSLYQCTNENIFRPNTRRERDLGIVFVGNSRRVFRPAVQFATASNIPLKVWGTKWEQFIDKSLIRGQSLNTNEAADVYRRADVVLNDHWQDQLSHGIANNRLLDVFACGTAVFTDHNIGSARLFPNHSLDLFTFTDFSSYTQKLAYLINNPSIRDNAVRSITEYTLQHHTFTHRAVAIREAVELLIRDYVTYKSEHLHALRIKSHMASRQNQQ